MDKIATLIEWIKDSKHTVFFGGAGTSTESGLKDFRSVIMRNMTIHQKKYYHIVSF